ncbi:flagellar hook-length control protein FliK [uncultured Paraglaciecola sp.]|uniref:flagellar hook-length control protein FliK n=1 Tax=uncultured Paraglaciecola sp. TaxID=1765024 RepID=UPI0030DCC6E9|tara:strand:- start:141603 stop:144020 length:2418 start_codon:yes stop_codon:yes gene_type:complete
MPDITQSSQATLTQALTQLSQLAPTSDAARQGVEVLVKHLAGNVLSLNKSAVLLNKVVLLNNPEIKGKLAEGQTHQLKISADPVPTLTFFSQASPKLSNVIPLTDQQLQSLLRLPAKQLLSGNVQLKADIPNKLPLINAQVISVLPKQQINAQITSNPGNYQIKSTPSEAQNVPLSNQQSILKLSLVDQKPPLEIALPIKQLNQFAPGEKVTLAITPRGNNWQLTILQNQTNGPKQTHNSVADSADKVQLKSQGATTPLPQAAPKLANPLLPQTAAANTTTSAAGTSASQEIKVANNQQSILTPLLATPVIKASLQGLSPTKPVSFELPVKAVLQQLTKTNQLQNHDLLQKLQSLPIDKLSLQIKPSGEIDLLLQNIKPVATIPVTKEIAQTLAPLKLPNYQTIIKQLDLPIETNKSRQSPRPEVHLAAPRSNTVVPQDNLAANKLRPIVPPVDGNQSAEIKLSLKEAAANLLTRLQDNPVTQSVISPSLLANKPQQLNLVQSLLRIVQAKAEPPAVTLQAVEKALGDTEFFKGVTEQPSKQLVEQVLQQVKQALPQGKEQDVNQIRQLLTTPALNLSALQMINPTSGQGFMSGLVTLLQMSLSARLSRTQTSRSEHITETLNNVLSGVSKTKSSATPKAMSDLSQLEQKHQLMKEIGRLLSGHQTSKLSNAEQMIQGQESFYYNLPSALGGNFKDIELLIKREENHQENTSEEGNSNKTWQLTMKLSVGELGELLTKAKLRADTLEINFYASNEAVKIQVMNYLPLLRRKFDSLGIEMSKSHCQLGKIPDTLQQRPYHMFQAKA